MTMTEEKKEESLVDWLKAKQEQLGLSYAKDLAARLGLHNETLSTIMTGKRAITPGNLETIFKNLKIAKGSPDYWRLLELAHFNRLSLEQKK